MTIYKFKNVPTTPTGKHIDLNQIKDEDLIQISQSVFTNPKHLTSLAIELDDLSSNEDDDSTVLPVILSKHEVEAKNREFFKTSMTKEFDNASDTESEDEIENIHLSEATRVKQFLSSPRIESRKSKKIHRSSDLDLNESGLLDKSYIDAEEIRNREIKEYDANKSIDRSNEISPELESLAVSLIDSKQLMKTERALLLQQSSDWANYLKDTDDISDEIRDKISTLIGFTDVLINGRFKKTMQILFAAEKYLQNPEASKQVYRADDIYGFMDVYKAESAKMLEDYEELKKQFNNSWQLEEPDNFPKPTSRIVSKCSSVPKKKPLSKVKSKIDMHELRQIASNQTKDKDASVENQDKDINKTVLTPTKIGIRDNAVIRSSSGSPIHEDTPRPSTRVKSPVRRSSRLSSNNLSFDMGSGEDDDGDDFAVDSDGFAMPTSINKGKRPNDNGLNISNNSTSKKART